MPTHRLIVFIGMVVAFFLRSSAAATIIDQPTPRQTLSLNNDWKFMRADVAGATANAFDDSGWAAVQLPHSWNASDGADGGGNYYRGVGIYRRHLDLRNRPELAGKSLYLHFGAVSSATQVFINGQSVGAEHKGMFGAFCYDVTKLIDLSRDNVLVVRASNAPDKDVLPLSADFTFYGGIYRAVDLIVTDPVCISPIDDASSGIYLKQSKVTTTDATVEATVKLHNDSDSEAQVSVQCDVLEADGHFLKSMVAPALVPAHGDQSCAVLVDIPNPHLWNARKDPYCYQCKVTVRNNDRALDALTQPLGLRFYSVDPERGFMLNGQSYPLHGVNRHQDRQGKGWAISDDDQREDFQLIADMGCTAIRLSHYEHAPIFYDLCDKTGIVAWAELATVNEITADAAFDANAKQQLSELIKQNFNHPSICFWSLFNELRDGPRGMPPDAARTAQLDQVKRLNDLAHELDSTRLTTAASDRPANNPLSDITDVIAFNRYFGWYNGSIANWAPALDQLHKDLPTRAIAISEYGAGASVIQHQAAATQPVTTGHWHPEEWQCTVHEAAYGAMKERPWLWGTFLWAMFDFGSDGRNEGDRPGINDKGLVTADRKIKKDAYFFYKANWSDEKFVYITERRFSPRAQADLPIKIYSNCDEVILSANGQVIGDRKALDHIFVFDHVALKSGDNQIEARGSSSGVSVTDACTIVVDPVAASASTQPVP